VAPFFKLQNASTHHQQNLSIDRKQVCLNLRHTLGEVKIDLLLDGLPADRAKLDLSSAILAANGVATRREASIPALRQADAAFTTCFIPLLGMNGGLFRIWYICPSRVAFVHVEHVLSKSHGHLIQHLLRSYYFSKIMNAVQIICNILPLGFGVVSSDALAAAEEQVAVTFGFFGR
jgi:hypothetical protein